MSDNYFNQLEYGEPLEQLEAIICIHEARGKPAKKANVRKIMLGGVSLSARDIILTVSTFKKLKLLVLNGCSIDSSLLQCLVDNIVTCNFKVDILELDNNISSPKLGDIKKIVEVMKNIHEELSIIGWKLREKELQLIQQQLNELSIPKLHVVTHNETLFSQVCARVATCDFCFEQWKIRDQEQLQLVASSSESGFRNIIRTSIREINMGDMPLCKNDLKNLSSVLRSSPYLNSLNLHSCYLNSSRLRIIVLGIIESKSKIQILNMNDELFHPTDDDVELVTRLFPQITWQLWIEGWDIEVKSWKLLQDKLNQDPNTLRVFTDKGKITYDQYAAKKDAVETAKETPMRVNCQVYYDLAGNFRVAFHTDEERYSEKCKTEMAQASYVRAPATPNLMQISSDEFISARLECRDSSDMSFVPSYVEYRKMEVFKVDGYRFLKFKLSSIPVTDTILDINVTVNNKETDNFNLKWLSPENFESRLTASRKSNLNEIMIANTIFKNVSDARIEDSNGTNKVTIGTSLQAMNIHNLCKNMSRNIEKCATFQWSTGYVPQKVHSHPVPASESDEEKNVASIESATASATAEPPGLCSCFNFKKRSGREHGQESCYGNPVIEVSTGDRQEDAEFSYKSI